MMQNPVLMLQDLGRQDARLTGERLPVVLPELSGGLRWEDLVVGPAGELCPGRAEGLLGGVVDVHIAPFEVLDPRQAGQVVHETDEALLARPQRLFRPLAFRNVAVDLQYPHRVALLVPLQHPMAGHDDLDAIPPGMDQLAFPLSSAQQVSVDLG